MYSLIGAIAAIIAITIEITSKFENLLLLSITERGLVLLSIAETEQLSIDKYY